MDVNRDISFPFRHVMGNIILLINN